MLPRLGYGAHVLQDDIRAIFAATAETQRRFVERRAGALTEVIRVTAAAPRDGRTLLFFGNGGSAADAQHLAAEFTNRYLLDRPPLPALALTEDPEDLRARQRRPQQRPAVQIQLALI